jgi:hypothetical protein
LLEAAKDGNVPLKKGGTAENFAPCNEKRVAGGFLYSQRQDDYRKNNRNFDDKK